jgi:putative FmdB family regulatory protein
MFFVTKLAGGLLGGPGREGPMPTYEYECRNCGHEFELEQRLTDRPAKTCVRYGRSDTTSAPRNGGSA